MGSSLVLQGGLATQNSIKERFTQNTHQFAVGDAIRYDAVLGMWVKSKADSAANAEVAGVVSTVEDPNTFFITYSGWMDIPQFNGLSLPAMFLSDTVNGGLTGSPPSAIGTVVKPVLVRASSGQGHIVVNYLGTQIGGSSTVAIDEIQPVGTIMPFAGSSIPNTWLSCDGASYGIGSYSELYAKLQYTNTTGDRVPMYGHVVTLTGTNVTPAISATDIIQFKNNVLPWSGTRYDSNADLIGVVLAVTSTTAVVQTLPTYTAATFSHPNVTFKTGSGTGTSNGTSQYRFWTSAGILKGDGGSVTFNTFSITHFNAPDLRGRFALGINSNVFGSDTNETDAAYSSAIRQYALASFGGQEGVPVDSTLSLGAGVSGKYTSVSSISTGTISNIPPYLATQYIIKARPYTRAAIIDGVDIPYDQLLIGDLRSGVLRGGAGSGEALVFKTNNGNDSGTERMRIDSAGNVGIGTAPTSYRLTVGGSSPQFSLMDTTSGGNLSRALITVTPGGVSFGNYYSGSAIPLGFNIGLTEVARFDTSGRFGIGTASPVTTLSIYNAGENVAINTFNQGLSNAGLEIETDYTANAYTPGVFWSTQNDSSTKPKAGINLLMTDAGTILQFGTSNAYGIGITNNSVKINQTGYLGIGLSVPETIAQTVPLQVNGTIQANEYTFQTAAPVPLRIRNSGGQVALEWTANTSGDLLLKTSSTERIKITNAGEIVMSGLVNCSTAGLLVNNALLTNDKNLPIGSIVCVNAGTTALTRNNTVTIYLSTTQTEYASTGSVNDRLTGTWRVRGVCSSISGNIIHLAERVS